MKNRTIEFQSIVESLHQKQNSVQPRKNEKQLRSEFSRMAGAIGRDINSTASKLEKLTKCILFSFLIFLFSFSFIEKVIIIN